MMVLEGLRVYWLDRETVYGLVWNKLKTLRGAEAQGLLTA
jgi:hypothetical protein